jgi:hypothetical protein
MDPTRVAEMTHSLTRIPSRRDLLRGLAGAGFGFAAGRLPDVAMARKGSTPQLNAFGCVDVGKPCRGADGLCCSGICEGKKPKKGRRDRSRCIAHDESTCLPGQRQERCGSGSNVDCTTSTGNTGGLCNTTTGNAGFCHASSVDFVCATDTECQAVCGPRAACVICGTETMCASPDEGACEIG